MRFGRRAAWAVTGLTVGVLVSLGAYSLLQPAPIYVDLLPAVESWGVPSSEPPLALQGGQTFETRAACVIPQFGRYPWREVGAPMDDRWEAATRAALTKQGLPAGAVTVALSRLRAVTPDEFVGFSNTHGVSSSRALYLPTFATTWRRGGQWVLCESSRTNFRSDTQFEHALLYRVPYLGREYHVGMFLACGNVSVFTPAPSGWMPPVPRAEPRGLVVPPGASGRGLPLPGGPVHEVPEPGSLALMIAALGALLWKKQPGLVLSRKPQGGAYTRAVPTGKR